MAPWRNFIPYLLSRLERDLAESKYMRRLAQLTVYQFFRIRHWGQKQISPSEEDIVQRLKVFSAYFKDNLQKELKDFKLPDDKEIEEKKRRQ